MIEWGFRFQRPQQLMRRFAREHHLVLYAANRFHRGESARLRPVESNVLEVFLPGDPAINVYQSLPSEQDVGRMLDAIDSLRSDLNLINAVIVAQHPYFTSLAVAMRVRFGWPIVYDCMDDHSGFLHNSSTVLETEDRLVSSADVVIASSMNLLRRVERRARSAMLLRNACEYEHFSVIFPASSLQGREMPRIGYYGAIAEWFDSRIVAELARLKPQWRFELIGSTLGADVNELRESANIRLLGERPYDNLPGLIAEWDLFIIPFKRVALTEATNPVKVYEMLATGKPVVAVGLPELIPIAEEGLIRLAGSAPQFATEIERELAGQEPETVERRRAFARRNTWQARHQDLANVISTLLPSTSTPNDVEAGTASHRPLGPHTDASKKVVRGQAHGILTGKGHTRESGSLIMRSTNRDR
jgi:glycosyltransferase involved in cell wall biosynthesis